VVRQSAEEVGEGENVGKEVGYMEDKGRQYDELPKLGEKNEADDEVEACGKWTGRWLPKKIGVELETGGNVVVT
jgi:hypothetical protein